jgi:TRAP-type C4-dicarboxylate transport system substrate-binding protein
VVAMRGFVDNAESSGVEQLKAAGMEVGELSSEDKAAFQEALAPAYEQYYNTYSKDLIDQIIATE